MYIVEEELLLYWRMGWDWRDNPHVDRTFDLVFPKPFVIFTDYSMIFYIKSILYFVEPIYNNNFPKLCTLLFLQQKLPQTIKQNQLHFS